MLKTLLMLFLKAVLSLRYRLKVTNLDHITKKGTTGILFLPNHPALIDPAIINSILFDKFSPLTLSDQKQINIPFIKPLISLFKPISLPDLKESRNNKQVVIKQLEYVADALKNQQNVLLYPSGRIYRSRYEDLRSNSSVEAILKYYPEVRVVLVRSSGLWGSSFSWGYTDFPGLFKFAKRNLLIFAANFLFFTPRRRVEIEFYEPEDFPRKSDRKTINRYIEKFYNSKAPANTFQSYFWFNGYKNRIISEPQLKNCDLNLENISPKTSSRVLEKLSEVTGIKLIKPTDSLANDLGLDSLALVDIALWIEIEFGFAQESLDHLQTVGDLLLAACGEVSISPKNQFKAISPKWFIENKSAKMIPYNGKTITEAFLNQASANPTQAVLADQIAGVKTNRDILTAIFVLKPMFKKYTDEKIGIMLPATVTASIVYLTVMFAGKTPVMVNWTVGESILKYSLESVNTKKVLTSKKLMEKLHKQGFDYSGCGIEWIYLEDIGASLSIIQKFIGALKGRFFPWLLAKSPISDTAAILFTSGSEAKPKAVPLTHHNFLSNIKDYLAVISLDNNNRLIGILPPFHSFGLSCSVILPLISGAKIIYHANPTEGAIIGELIGMYKINVLFGTPTFVNGILRTTNPEKLSSVSLVVTGAEKCPNAVYDKIAEICPKAVMSEGYGITECSPVVSLNDLSNPAKGSIGKILPNMQYKLLHPETLIEVNQGEQGLLILRGENIFGGYLNFNGNSPFIKYNGLDWYNTGDLVKQDADNVLFFTGRLKRFVKIGGEMISLTAIEEVLSQTFQPDENGLTIAVDAESPDENPELVLFATFFLERESVNKLLRTTGLSGLHNIRRIIQIDNIPLLGSGKTDYRKLKELF